MTSDRPTNLPASVRARLRDLARARSLDFELVLIRYASERLLYRLAVSRHEDRFVLKGAMLFLLWEEGSHRPTRDVDLLGFGVSDPEHLEHVFREVCEQDVVADGLRFVAESVRAESIRDDQVDGGVRVRLHALRYRLAVDRYLAEKGYLFKALVAFSGTVQDRGKSYTEAGMNSVGKARSISERQTAKEFEKAEYRFLIVANKFQTGFDQPLLHTMYVDKKLGGVNTVQTLSRLNRTHRQAEEWLNQKTSKTRELKSALR